MIAQPGRGGGLCILNIYDYAGKPFQKDYDTLLKIHHFALSENGDKQLFSIEPKQEKNHSFSQKEKTFFYLPPYIGYIPEERKLPNQRLVLIYSNDTMTIDFIDVIADNGSGYSQVVENIYFNPGYYKSYREPSKVIKGFSEDTFVKESDRNELSKALLNGINTNTDYILVAWNLLKYIPDLNLENKRLRRSRNSCKEEVVLKKYYTLCEKKITIKGNVIEILTESKPTIINKKSTFHFYYYYSFSGRFIGQTEEDKLARDILLSIEKLNLRVNGKNYTGIIKLAIGFTDAGISSTYSGTGVWIIEYLNGNKININKLIDVDPETLISPKRSG